MNIRTLLVDDENGAREALQDLLLDFTQFEIVGQASDGYQAVSLVESLKPQLVFLDIQMPELDGFDVLELIQGKDLMVIFVTAYDAYAVQAFEQEALDYLLKPVSPKRLSKTVKRIMDRLTIPNSQAAKLSALQTKHPEANRKTNKPIMVNHLGKVLLIDPQNLVYLEAQNDFVELHQQDGTSYLKLDRMANMEKQLAHRGFVRVHRSFLINLTFMEAIGKSESGSREAIMVNNQRVPISKSGYTKLKPLIGKQ